MTKGKEEREWKSMRVSGLLGVMHRMVMLFTFPFRKFWLLVAATALILAVLVAVPMFHGIKLRDVKDWYMIKLPSHEFVAAKDKTVFKVSDNLDKLKQTFREVSPKRKEAAKKEKKKEEVRFVSWNVAEFRKARYKPSQVLPKVKENEASKNVEKESVTVSSVAGQAVESIKHENVFDDNAEAVVYVEPENVAVEMMTPNEPQYDAMEYEADDAGYPEPEVEDKIQKDADESLYLKDYYFKVKRKDLEYLAEPEIIQGNVSVYDANSLYVGERFLYLYGIYSHPHRYDVVAAVEFLKKITQGKDVYCGAVAYSLMTETPAALCFVDGELINKLLVEQGFAKNVALR